MQDTLIFIQASTGTGARPFPINAHCKVPPPARGNDIYTSTYVYKRMKDVTITEIVDGVRQRFAPRESELKVLCNEPVVAERVPAEDILVHEPLGAGAKMHDYLRTHPHIKTVVRLLGTHTLTDPTLIFQTLQRFSKLPNDIKRTHKFGPNVCHLGQNIEVFTPEALANSERMAGDPASCRRTSFNEHITSLMPSAPSWEVVDAKTLEAMVKNEFYPFISPFPGFVQTRSLRNVRTLLGSFSKSKMPMDFGGIWTEWWETGLSMGGWDIKKGWSEKGFAPTKMFDVFEAVQRGVVTVAPEIN